MTCTKCQGTQRLTDPSCGTRFACGWCDGTGQADIRILCPNRSWLGEHCPTEECRCDDGVLRCECCTEARATVHVAGFGPSCWACAGVAAPVKPMVSAGMAELDRLANEAGEVARAERNRGAA